MQKTNVGFVPPLHLSRRVMSSSSIPKPQNTPMVPSGVDSSPAVAIRQPSCDVDSSSRHENGAAPGPVPSSQLEMPTNDPRQHAEGTPDKARLDTERVDVPVVPSLQKHCEEPRNYHGSATMTQSHRSDRLPGNDTRHSSDPGIPSSWITEFKSFLGFGNTPNTTNTGSKPHRDGPASGFGDDYDWRRRYHKSLTAAQPELLDTGHCRSG